MKNHFLCLILVATSVSCGAQNVNASDGGTGTEGGGDGVIGSDGNVTLLDLVEPMEHEFWHPMTYPFKARLRDNPDIGLEKVDASNRGVFPLAMSFGAGGVTPLGHVPSLLGGLIQFRKGIHDGTLPKEDLANVDLSAKYYSLLEDRLLQNPAQPVPFAGSVDLWTKFSRARAPGPSEQSKYHWLRLRLSDLAGAGSGGHLVKFTDPCWSYPSNDSDRPWYGTYKIQMKVPDFVKRPVDPLLWIFTNEPLENIHDEGAVRLTGEGGVPVQIAIQRDGVVVVHRPSFLKMETRSQVALVMHEVWLAILMRVAPEKLKLKGTADLRRFVRRSFQNFDNPNTPMSYVAEPLDAYDFPLNVLADIDVACVEGLCFDP